LNMLVMGNLRRKELHTHVPIRGTIAAQRRI
jgi:hypothetical protein